MFRYFINLTNYISHKVYIKIAVSCYWLKWC